MEGMNNIYTPLENVIIFGRDFTYDGEPNAIVFGFNKKEIIKLTADGRTFINGKLVYDKDETGLYDTLLRMVELYQEEEVNKYKELARLRDKAEKQSEEPIEPPTKL